MKRLFSFLVCVLCATGARAQDPVPRMPTLQPERSHPTESVDTDTLADDAGVQPGGEDPGQGGLPGGGRSADED